MPLVIKNLHKVFDHKVIFEDFSYAFEEKGLYVLMGKSGRGKTTLLRMIAGLDKNYTGEIKAEASAYAFQEYRLFPTLNALENITKILWEKPTAKQITKTKSLLAYLSFTENDMQLYPHALSGGMKQRVALCRALLAQRSILLLDEPFKELDAALRRQLCTILQKESKHRLIILTAHSLDSLNGLDHTVIEIS